MGFVSASTGYPRCRLLYVHKEKEAKKEECGGGRCGSENERNSGFCLDAFYENSEQASLDSLLADHAPMAIGYLWFPSRGKTHAGTCMYKRIILHTCQQILANTHTFLFVSASNTSENASTTRVSTSYQTHSPFSLCHRLLHILHTHCTEGLGAIK